MLWAITLNAWPLAYEQLTAHTCTSINRPTTINLMVQVASRLDYKLLCTYNRSVHSIDKKVEVLHN